MTLTKFDRPGSTPRRLAHQSKMFTLTICQWISRPIKLFIRTYFIAEGITAFNPIPGGRARGVSL
jgi:hypothetical protein